MSGRADPFAADDELDLTDFAAKPAARPKIDVAAVREASEKNRFPSRAATPSTPAAELPSPVKAPQRRRRTGRNLQLNLKVTQDTLTRFNALADAMGIGLAETFEAALESLERSRPHNT